MITNLALQAWIYQHWVAGYSRSKESYHEADNLKVHGLNLAFSGNLHCHNHGDGYWDDDWVIRAQESDGAVALCKHHLTIHADPTEHLRPDAVLTIGEILELKCPKNLVEADRYVAVGNAGKPQGDRLQFCIHLEASQVNELMEWITTKFNASDLRFTLAVLYDPLDYPRREAAILQVQLKDRPIALPLLLNWINQTSLLPEIPLFTTPIQPGLGAIEVPEKVLDIFQYHCQQAATAQLEALQF